MKIFVVIAALLGVVSGQYDYPVPNRGFTSGGTTERPIYGLPNHTPGIPIGPSGVPAPAPAAPVQQAPARRPIQVSAPAPTFSQQKQYQHQAPTFSQQNPTFSQGPAFSQPQPQSQHQEQEQEAESYTPKVFRHVYVHSAPDEPEDRQSRTIRVPGGDKHVNIIFVKTPSSSSSHQTEVVLPEQDEHKNLVYVLLKKGENTADVKIRKPAPAPQRKPEVYFIRYGGQQQQGNGGYQQPQQQQRPQQQQEEQQISNGGNDFQNQNQGYQQAPVGIRPPSPIRSQADVPSSGYGLPL